MPDRGHTLGDPQMRAEFKRLGLPDPEPIAYTCWICSSMWEQVDGTDPQRHHEWCRNLRPGDHRA